MRFGYSETCLDHETGPRHPENADRLLAIREGLKHEHGVDYVEVDPVDKGALTAVHDADYVDEVEAFCAAGGGEWDPDTIAVEATWDALRTSAGLARWAARQALDGADGRETPFSIGRPPGHHAEFDDAMGFCFANNVAIAAQDALDSGADRVAIVDWDVHHGNGTQDVFYDRGDVMFVSLHESGLFPGTGRLAETGAGEGEGTTLNVPLPAGVDDADYQFVFETVVTPAVESFDPDLLLVSAGFDAHEHDPISRTRVSTEGFGTLTTIVRDLADGVGGALAFVLEGGYSLNALSDSVVMVNDVFDGYRPVEADEAAGTEVENVVSELTNDHSAIE
jgi:acetoin utilization deacetylase AcuC-like enzyme